MKNVLTRITRTALITMVSLAMLLSTVPVCCVPVFASEQEDPQVVLEETDPVEENEVETPLKDEDVALPAAMEEEEDPSAAMEEEEGPSAGAEEDTKEPASEVEEQPEDEPASPEELSEEETDELPSEDSVDAMPPANEDQLVFALTQSAQGNGSAEEAAGQTEAPPAPLTAAPMNVKATSYSGTYNGKAHSIKLTGVPGGASVQYSTDGKTWRSAAPSRTAAGKTTVYYRVKNTDGKTVSGKAAITIKRSPLKKVSLSTTVFTYNGKAREPSVSVYGNVTSSKLKKGKDYTVKLAKGRTNVGTYSITVTGTGNYQGTINKTITIKATSLKSASLSKSVFTYDGKAHEPKVSVYGSASSSKLVKGKDYTVKLAKGRINAGKYSITITGKGNYKGTLTKTITIKPAPLKKITFSTVTFMYNGKAREPKVYVYGSVYDSKLKKGRDYTVTLEAGRKAVGKYQITVKGTGNYRGTISKSMHVKPARAAMKTPSLTSSTLKVKMKDSASAYGAAYFQIAYKKSGGSWKYVKTDGSSKSLNVPEANTYYVKARAIKKADGRTYYGAWSKTSKVNNTIPVKAQKVINSAKSTPFYGQGWCAAWVCSVFDRSGVLTSARMPYASDYYRAYCTSSNRADLKPGMIVASKYSYAGGYAGHIGIYIGNGKVISNETSITVKTIDEFAATYSHGYPIKWGWMNNKKLL